MIMGFLARFALGRVVQSVGQRAAASLPWQIWAALGVAVVLGIGAWQINDRAYDRGYADADAAWQVAVQEERERQDEANQKALREAEARIAQLEEAKAVRDATIERLTAEAAADPDAGRVSVGAPSVRRLNSVLD